MEQTINEELLRKTQAEIKAEAEHFDMGAWYDFNECGTTACIAGWVVKIGHNYPSLKAASVSKRNSPMGSIPIAAKRLLNVNPSQASRLFHTIYWPADFRRRYAAAQTPKEKAQVACDRIDHFIETKGKV